jgi:hypothetical protein
MRQIPIARVSFCVSGILNPFRALTQCRPRECWKDGILECRAVATVGRRKIPSFLPQKSRPPRAKDALSPKNRVFGPKIQIATCHVPNTQTPRPQNRVFRGASPEYQNTRIPHEPKRYSVFFAPKRHLQRRTGDCLVPPALGREFEVYLIHRFLRFAQTNREIRERREQTM